MKRLLSWLLALVMIISCLPLSALPAFAEEPDVDVDAGSTETTEEDFTVEMDDLTEGMKSNPIDLTSDLLYEGDFAATVTVPAGKTLYYRAYRVAGMNMTINDGEAVVCTGDNWNPYVWSIKNETDADAEYVIKVAQPVGSMDNPATLVLGENKANITAGAQGYFYTYTAEQAGTLVLEISTDPATGWTYSVNNVTTGVCGDIQWSDSDPVVNPYEVEVAAGDELKIMVNTYDAANPWSAPAGTVTVNASYKAEEPVVLPVINFKAITVSFDAEIKLGLRFILPDVFLADEGAKAVVTKYTNYDKGMQTTVTEYTVAELSALGTDSQGRTTIFQGTASGEMTADITYEFFNSNGDKLMITDYSNGDAEVDVITRSVLDYAEAALTKGTAKQKAINTALVVYGGYAQMYFKVDTQNPAYNLLTKLGLDIPDISGINADSISQVVTNSGAKGSGYGIYQDKQTAGLDSAIYLKPYFYVESGYSIDDFTFEVTYLTAAGESYTEAATPEVLNNGARYGITVHDIPGAYLDHSYTITATHKTSGQVYTVNSSVMSWVKSLLAASTNAAQLNLGRAMKFYSDAANTYFNK